MANRLSFLFDECLTPELTGVATDRGFPSTHVNFLGLTGTPDHALAPLAIGQDFTFVTNTADDYRTLYRRAPLHPGLIIILPSVRLDLQLRLFGLVLDAISTERDLVNRLVEVDADGHVTVQEFSAQV